MLKSPDEQTPDELAASAQKTIDGSNFAELALIVAEIARRLPPAPDAKEGD